MAVSTTAFAVNEALHLSFDEYPRHTLSEYYVALTQKLSDAAKQADYPEGTKQLIGFFSVSSPNTRRRWQDEKISPLYRRHMLGRKMFIDGFAQAAIKNDATFVIILGSGLSANGRCLAKQYPHVKVIEIEHPDTLIIKQQVFTQEENITLQINSELNSFSIDNFIGIAANLNEIDIHNTLSAHGLSSEDKAVFILEGLTMYFTYSELETLLAQVHICMSPESELLLSFNLPNAARSIDEQQALVQAKETMKFSLTPEKVIEFCNTHNFEVTGQMPQATLHSIFGETAEQESIEASQKPNSKGENHFSLKIANAPQSIKEINDIPILSKPELLLSYQKTCQPN